MDFYDNANWFKISQNFDWSKFVTLCYKNVTFYLVWIYLPVWELSSLKNEATFGLAAFRWKIINMEISYHLVYSFPIPLQLYLSKEVSVSWSMGRLFKGLEKLYHKTLTANTIYDMNKAKWRLEILNKNYLHPFHTTPMYFRSLFYYFYYFNCFVCQTCSKNISFSSRNTLYISTQVFRKSENR